MPDFDGMSGGPLSREDLKMGVEHIRAFKRIAVVTDIGWVHHLTGLFGWMTPGETKILPKIVEREAAIAWVAELTIASGHP